MGKFILGIMVAVVAIAAALFVYTHFGFLDLRADQSPGGLERRFAMQAMDASTDRHAPDVKNPIEPTEANLLDGVKLYKNDCALCHGSPLNPSAELGLAEYPPAPQFMKHAPDMPDNQNYYIVQHGVRWTAMPGWDKVMAESEIWQVVTFLSRMEKLPPAVEAQWKKPLTP